MQISWFVLFCFTLILQCSARTAADSSGGAHSHGDHHKGHHHHDGHHNGHHKGHHHNHKGHHHGKHHNVSTNAGHHASQQLPNSSAITAKMTAPIVETVAAQSGKTSKTSHDEQLVAKMKALELHLAKKKSEAVAMEKGHILVNGPIPIAFKEQFSQAVAHATGIDAGKVAMVGTSSVADQPGVVAVEFKAPAKIVEAVENQSADPDSKLATGNLHSFLVAKNENVEAKHQGRKETEDPKQEEREEPPPLSEVTPVQEKGIDIDTAMPYGDLEPFGREDTAQELTENSVKESDEMVDQLERAEVAEEKRSVFRALTRLRGAAITSFDGVARSQTGNIDEYNKIHQWRKTHPLHHLADEESDVSKWAFPDNADF